MANNHLLFSETLPLVSNEAAEWCRTRLRELTTMDDDETGSLRCDFDWRLREPDGPDPAAKPELVMYSEEHASPWNVALFVREYLAKFDPLRVWSFTWACTCDKPRSGEFGGGACVVSAREIRALPVEKWRRDTEADLAADVLAAAKPERASEDPRVRGALRAFCDTIEVAGGVRQTAAGALPEGDPDWIDLGEAYLLACEALGRVPVEAPADPEET